jgi:hypothetical protein
MSLMLVSFELWCHTAPVQLRFTRAISAAEIWAHAGWVAEFAETLFLTLVFRTCRLKIAWFKERNPMRRHGFMAASRVRLASEMAYAW